MVTIRMSVPPDAAASFAIIARQILLKKKKKEKSQRKRRWWYRRLFHRRLQYDNQLFKDMQVELVDDIIKNFTRMTLEDCEYLASRVCPKITRMDTNTREAITAKERLYTLTLRYLATGDSCTRGKMRRETAHTACEANTRILFREASSHFSKQVESCLAIY